MELRKKNVWRKFTSNRQFGIFLVLVIMMVFLTIASDKFFTADNLLSVLNQASMKGVLAIGMTFVIIMGGIDLSVGSILSLSAMFTADILVKYGLEALPLAIIAAVITGIVCGLVNGFLIAQFNLAPFLVTMATMNIYRGIDYVYSGAISIRGLPSEWIEFWSTSVIPVAVVIFAIVVVVSYIIVKYTKYGRYVYAVGGNEEATKLSGVSTKGVKITTYMLMGIMCAIGGLIYVGRMSSAEATAGTGYEMDAIAAAAIGGASLAGGRGSMVGTVLGSIILALLMNGLTLLNVQAFYQIIMTGAVIIIAILIDKLTNK